MRTAQDDVQTALNAQLLSLGLGLIAWENKQLDSPATAWLRPTFMPAPVSDLTTKSESFGSWLVGVYQVDVFAPLNGGDGLARDMASGIEAGFPKGGIFTSNGTSVRIGRSYREVGRRDAEMSFFHIPVKIEFYANF